MKTHISYIFLFAEEAVKLNAVDDEPYNSYLVLLIYLVKMAQSEDTCLPDDTEDNKEVKKMFVCDRFFARHACNVYKPTQEMSREHVADCMRVNCKDILFKALSDGVDEEHPDPNFVLLVDHGQSSIVLCIQGTSTFNDLMTDLTVQEEEFLDGYAHRGFCDGSDNVLEKVSKSLLKGLNNNPGYNVVVCGHSLGGSLAVVTTIKLLTSNQFITLPPGVSVRCVALAPAPVYRSDQETPATLLDKIHIYVNDKDVIPRLSLGSAAKLLKMLRVVDEMALSDDMQLSIVLDKEDPTGDLELALWEIKEAVKKVEQDKVNYMYHVGRVIHLVNKDGVLQMKLKAGKDAMVLASSIEIHDNMVGDHNSDKYLDMFTTVFTR